MIARQTLSAALALACLWLGAGCIAFNPDCPEDGAEGERGFLGERVLIDKVSARHANNAIGQLAAAAFRRSLDGSSRPAELGVINGGGIRAEGICKSRPALPEGPLSASVLREVLLFDNQIIVLDLTRNEVLWLMENAVRGLSRAGEPILNPPGSFLHLDGARMQVDCSREVLLGEGEVVDGWVAAPGGVGRVVSLVLDDGRDLVQAPETTRVRVALSDYLINFGEGTSHLLRGRDNDPDRNPARVQKEGGIDSRLAVRHLVDHHPDAARALRVDPLRVELLECAVPAGL